MKSLGQRGPEPRETDRRAGGKPASEAALRFILRRWSGPDCPVGLPLSRIEENMRADKHQLLAEIQYALKNPTEW